MRSLRDREPDRGRTDVRDADFAPVVAVLVVRAPGLPAGLLADLAEGVGDGAAEATGAGRVEVGDHAEAGTAEVLDRERHAELAVAARLAVVEELDHPRGRRLVVVAGGVGVGGIVDRAAHG